MGAGAVVIYSISWDCGADAIRIAVNDDASSPDVTVLSSAGQVAASVSDMQGLPGRTVYEAPLGDDTIFSIRAISIDGRGVSTASETLRTEGACTGERILERYGAGTGAPAKTSSKPQQAPPDAGDVRGADSTPPPGAEDPGYAPAPAPAGADAPPMPPPPAEFEIEEGRDASHYVKRYAEDDAYRGWFDDAYPQYVDICEAVGADPGCVEKYAQRADAGSAAAGGTGGIPPECGEGMVERDGRCVEAGAADGGGAAGDKPEAPSPAPSATGDDSGCLVATAAFGTELAPQVQALREVRDGTLLSTRAGSDFMAAFGAAYYAVSPHVADLERESPAFRQAVALALAPMLHALSIVALAESGSEAGVLAYGIAAIALVAGMYVAAPVAAAAAAARLAAGRRVARARRPS